MKTTKNTTTTTNVRYSSTLMMMYYVALDNHQFAADCSTSVVQSHCIFDTVDFGNRKLLVDCEINEKLCTEKKM